MILQQPFDLNLTVVNAFELPENIRSFITPNRFPNSKALAAHCGLDPSLKISAKHVTGTKKCGGNKALHKTLVSCGERLIRNHTEMFSRWGYNLYLQTAKKEKHPAQLHESSL